MAVDFEYFLQIAPESINRTQYDAAFTFPPFFLKWANSHCESKNTNHKHNLELLVEEKFSMALEACFGPGW
uniref:Uncharacterized protein n=1 Tax=Arion vulgaris TaxID=1028688 RepID=A0A0B6Z0A6_9EUPU